MEHAYSTLSDLIVSTHLLGGSMFMKRKSQNHRSTKVLIYRRRLGASESQKGIAIPSAVGMVSGKDGIQIRCAKANKVVERVGNVSERENFLIDFVQIRCAKVGKVIAKIGKVSETENWRIDFARQDMLHKILMLISRKEVFVRARFLLEK